MLSNRYVHHDSRNDSSHISAMSQISATCHTNARWPTAHMAVRVKCAIHASLSALPTVMAARRNTSSLALTDIMSAPLYWVFNFEHSKCMND